MTPRSPTPSRRISARWKVVPRESSNIFCAASEYSAAPRSLTVVGIVPLLVHSSQTRLAISVDQPAPQPAVHDAVGTHRAGRDQPAHRARHLLQPEPEQARQQSLVAEDRAT